MTSPICFFFSFLVSSFPRKHKDRNRFAYISMELSWKCSTKNQSKFDISWCLWFSDASLPIAGIYISIGCVAILLSHSQHLRILNQIPILTYIMRHTQTKCSLYSWIVCLCAVFTQAYTWPITEWTVSCCCYKEYFAGTLNLVRLAGYTNFKLKKIHGWK